MKKPSKLKAQPTNGLIQHKPVTPAVLNQKNEHFSLSGRLRGLINWCMYSALSRSAEATETSNSPLPEKNVAAYAVT